MDIRNPVFTADNRIDCEVKHPAYGWIPFTADPNDVEPHGREIYARALAVGPAAYAAPPVVPPAKAEQEAKRHAAYTEEADPLYFKWQAGEGTEEEWLAKRQEIRDRYPYPAE
jgi:hypothetical protein